MWNRLRSILEPLSDTELPGRLTELLAEHAADPVGRQVLLDDLPTFVEARGDDPAWVRNLVHKAILEADEGAAAVQAIATEAGQGWRAIDMNAHLLRREISGDTIEAERIYALGPWPTEPEGGWITVALAPNF